MKACANCGCYCRPDESRCPHCESGFEAASSELPHHSRAAAALLLGLSLGMNGCVGQSKYGVPDSMAQAEYGVPDTAYVDDDGDGWAVRDGDCDDTNSAIHPEATETPGDGIDSNCNDEDDT